MIWQDSNVPFVSFFFSGVWGIRSVDIEISELKVLWCLMDNKITQVLVATAFKPWLDTPNDTALA